MSSKHFYRVSVFNTEFSSLENAKWNVKISFTRQEAKKYFSSPNDSISHYIDGKLHSETPILVDELGNISFGRTRRV